MTKRRKRRYYDTYESIKGFQIVSDLSCGSVHDPMLDDFMLNRRPSKLNRKRKSTVGFVERVRDR